MGNLAKGVVLSVIGFGGSFIASLFGGWTAGMETLVIFMVIDYISGVLRAAIFKNSGKSESGALNSSAGWKGLARKVMTLLMVAVSHRLDLMTGANYIRDAVVIGFCANECISIVENCGKMGLPLPSVITKAIEILQDKENKNE